MSSKQRELTVDQASDLQESGVQVYFTHELLDERPIPVSTTVPINSWWEWESKWEPRECLEREEFYKLYKFFVEVEEEIGRAHV